MKVCPAVAAVAVLVAVAPQAVARSIVAEDDDKAYPVSKVVTLLKDMAAQLQKEGEEDEEVYDKMACWCTTNDKDKTKTIEDAESHIADLGTTIEATTAQSSRLGTEITNHESDLSKATKALDEATSLRGKQLSDFTDEEKDLLQSINALKSALVVLSKHHSSAVLLDTSTVSSIASMIKTHHFLLEGTITPHQRRTVSALVQAPSYTPASGEIFGILNQMKETFETNLASSQKEALGDQKQYEDLKSAKEDEINAISSSIEEKKVTLASADEKNAQAKEDLQDTQSGLTADETFLIDLKKRCSNMDAEWETRQKMRQEEQTAIAEAISILASDEAHDNFSKTLSFFQRGARVARVSSQRRKAALRILRKAAGATKDSSLAALAAAAELDAFVEVKAAIDKMVSELQQAKEADIKHKDSCINQLNENTRFVEQGEREQSDLSANIDALTATINEITGQVETLKSEISEMHIQMKRAGEDREAENKDFQQTVNDQRETQKLLNKALSVLKGVYAKKGSFVQLKDVRMHSVRQGPPPPEGFGEYKKAGGAGGVVGLLQQIIQEAKHMEAEAIRDEEEAQEKYEGFVKETNNSVETKGESIVNKNQDKADTEQSLTQANTDHASVSTELETLSNGAGALHQSCDFLMKNFDIRMQGYDQEVEALQQAKAILSGMGSED